MRNKHAYAIMKRMNDINAMWNNRNIEDATAEPEWREYESLMYVLAEFICV